MGRPLQGTSRPAPVLRRFIPKPGTAEGDHWASTVRDRIVQQAAKLVLEPIFFEADFLPCSYGYRPGCNATQAMEVIREGYIRGHTQVVEVDIADFFSSIDHTLLLDVLAERISDRRVLKLLRLWLEAEVMEEGQTRKTVCGTPQGGVISPLLSNIYLHVLDRAWAKHGTGVMVRHADDVVVMCKSPGQAVFAEKRMGAILTSVRLEANSVKTRRVDLREGRDGFDFLGCHFHARLSGRLLERGIRRYYLYRWPSTDAMRRVRQRSRSAPVTIAAG